jgi:hypothetical protein
MLRRVSRGGWGALARRPTFGGTTEVTATDIDSITSQADFSITKSGPATVIPGNNIVYNALVGDTVTSAISR